MNQLNSIIIEGNIVKDAELKEPKDGFKVCELCVAVNRYFKNSKGEGVSEVSYFDIEAYGKSAEIAQEKCVKGRGVRVVGRLKQNRWTDANGKAISKIKIVAEHIEFKPIFNKPNTNSPMDEITQANSHSYEQELKLENSSSKSEETLTHEDEIKQAETVF